MFTGIIILHPNSCGPCGFSQDNRGANGTANSNSQDMPRPASQITRIRQEEQLPDQRQGLSDEPCSMGAGSIPKHPTPTPTMRAIQTYKKVYNNTYCNYLELIVQLGCWGKLKL